MIYEKDWIMRQIKTVIEVVLRLVLGKQDYHYIFEDESRTSQADRLYIDIDRLLRQNRINEAENLLFVSLDESSKKHLELALDFYARLNAMSDETLTAAGFERDEIADGLDEILKKFGVDK